MNQQAANRCFSQEIVTARPIGIVPDESTIKADFDALNELVVNCPDLLEIESLIGGFNLFSVLGFEYGEIRHSNALAWLFDPKGSHGLGSRFLQRWLMTVLHETEADCEITPVDIDCWDLRDVEIHREWKHIDLLFVMEFTDRSKWIISIENKVGSKQHSNQLRRYREIIEQSFPEADKRIFIFLTKDEETPEDDTYICATYDQVHDCLETCRDSNLQLIGQEPRVLIDNYLRLLEEKFMNESEIAELAHKIYKQHKHALDLIYEHRPDSIKLVSDKLQELLSKSEDELGIRMAKSNKWYVRFTPKAWDVDSNTHGPTNWGNRTILVEIALSPRSIAFKLISGHAPAEWIEPLWNQSSQPPFKQTKRQSKRPAAWVCLYSASIKVGIPEDDLDSLDDVANKIFERVKKELLSDDVQEVIKIVADVIPELDNYFES